MIDEYCEDYLTALVNMKSNTNQSYRYTAANYIELRKVYEKEKTIFFVKYLLCLHQYPNAERIAKMYLFFNKRSVELRSLLSQAQLQQGKIEEAEKNISKAMEINGDATIVLDVLADIYIASNRWQDAARILEKILELSPLGTAWIEKLAFVNRKLR